MHTLLFVLMLLLGVSPAPAQRDRDVTLPPATDTELEAIAGETGQSPDAELQRIAIQGVSAERDRLRQLRVKRVEEAFRDPPGTTPVEKETKRRQVEIVLGLRVPPQE